MLDVNVKVSRPLTYNTSQSGSIMRLQPLFYKCIYVAKNNISFIYAYCYINGILAKPLASRLGYGISGPCTKFVSFLFMIIICVWVYHHTEDKLVKNALNVCKMLQGGWMYSYLDNALGGMTVLTFGCGKKFDLGTWALYSGTASQTTDQQER